MINDDRQFNMKKFLTISNILILINVVTYFAVLKKYDTNDYSYLVEAGGLIVPLDGEYYRLFTCMFLHSGWFHLVNNMIVIFIIGNSIEKNIGKVALLCVYILGGLCGSVFSMAYFINMKKYNTVSIGASGAGMALLGAMIAFSVLDNKKKDVLQVKDVIFCLFLTLLLGLTSEKIDNAAHFGGFFSGFIIEAVFLGEKKYAAYRYNRRH